jgi:hypothetical protein
MCSNFIVGMVFVCGCIFMLLIVFSVGSEILWQVTVSAHKVNLHMQRQKYKQCKRINTVSSEVLAWHMSPCEITCSVSLFIFYCALDFSG